MKLWRLTRAPFVALDGAGPERHGARYTSQGRPVVNFTSEAALAVLVLLRYLPRDLAGVEDDYLLGWTEVDAVPLRLPETRDSAEMRRLGDAWLDAGEHLLAAVRSAVVPEADIVMMNPLHPGAVKIAPLSTRPFSFAECLHVPPMLARYEGMK